MPLEAPTNFTSNSQIQMPKLPTFPELNSLGQNATERYSNAYDIFTDHHDAGIWIERVCNRFIEQKLKLLLRAIDAKLLAGELDNLLDTNVEYQAELDDELKKRKKLSVWKYMQTFYPAAKNRYQREKIMSQEDFDHNAAETFIEYEDWRKAALKRKYLSFYHVFNMWQYKLYIFPAVNRQENPHQEKPDNSLIVQIIAKNRNMDFEHTQMTSNQLQSNWLNRNVIYDLQTQHDEDQLYSTLTVNDKPYSPMNLEHHLHELQAEQLEPNVDLDIEMICLQALFYAHTSMLNYYMHTRRGRVEWPILNCNRHLIDFQAFDPDINKEAFDLTTRQVRTHMPQSFNSMHNPKVEYILIKCLVVFGHLTDTFEIILAPTAVYVTDMEFYKQFHDKASTQGGFAQVSEKLDDEQFPTHNDRIPKWKDLFSKIHGNVQISYKEMPRKPVLALSWPLHDALHEALKDGIMFAPTAKATHHMSIPPTLARVVPWRANSTHTFECPGWAWFHILMQLEEADVAFETLNGYRFDDDQDLLSEHEVGNLNSEGIFHLLQALAEYGPYDIMTFGDKNMNIFTLFISCTAIHIRQCMQNTIQSMSKLHDVLNTEDFCTDVLNLVCKRYVTKNHSMPSELREQHWWQSCDIEKQPFNDFMQAQEFRTFWHKKKEILFPSNESDDFDAKLPLRFAVCLLMAYDMVQLQPGDSKHSMTRNAIEELCIDVFKHYSSFHDQDPVNMARDMTSQLQQRINEQFVYYMQSDAGRVILNLCGYSKITIKNITEHDHEFGSTINKLKTMIFNDDFHFDSADDDDDDDDDDDGTTSYASVYSTVRKVAWQKMVACRLEAKHRNTIDRQKQGKTEAQNNKKEVSLDLALIQNNYVNLVHTILRQSKARLTEDVAYACFVNTCCQTQDHQSVEGHYIIGGMELWMPIILYHSKAWNDAVYKAWNATWMNGFVANNIDEAFNNLQSKSLHKLNQKWHKLLQPNALFNSIHESEPRLEMAIDLLVLARHFFEDSHLYDNMLRVQPHIHKPDSVHNTIARPEEIVKDI